jgi:D-alanine-D-alanine ligase
LSQKKLSLLVLCGGRSAEHEISIISARNICKAVDTSLYDLHLVVIDKSGQWSLRAPSELEPDGSSNSLIGFASSNSSWALVPFKGGARLVNLDGSSSLNIDVVFPVLHGPNGEDGSMQGLLKLYDLPFVGPGILGSAVAMDKEVAKRLLRDAGLPNARFISLTSEDVESFNADAIVEELGLPCFVKPANMGSSVGVSKVRSREELCAAVKYAFAYDRKVLVEEAIVGREIEVAVLGNDVLRASVPGEVRPVGKHDFYSYESKYLDENGAELIAPAQLSKDLAEKAKTIALSAAKALECFGMVRVDLFLKPDGDFFINELNTIPGFTSISMYPKLWSLSGISYGELVSQLLALAIERSNRERALTQSF